MSLATYLDRLDDAVEQGDSAAAARLAAQLFQRLELGRASFGEAAGPFASVESEATRAAAAITRLLANPGFKPGKREWAAFITFKRVLAQIFEVSGYRGTAHLPRWVMAAARKSRRKPSVVEAARLLMGTSINDATPAVLALLRTLPPAQALVCVLAFLSEYVIWSAQAEAAHAAIARSAWLPETAELSQVEWTLLASAWMACSYSDAPGKHDIKSRLNLVVRNWLKSRGMEAAAQRPPVVQGDGRPTLLIISEIYYPGHAMDRCYRPAIASLKKHFRTVMMFCSEQKRPVEEGLVDTLDKTPFDIAHPEKFLRQARAHAPAITWFPSAGMRIAGIAAANLRIAPIQVLSMGHPATTRSDCMDYAVVVDGALGDPALFSETVLLRPSEPHYVGVETAAVPPNIRRAPETVRFAVPAWIRKLTPGFMETCREIARLAGRPVEFWIFPNLRGTLFQAARRRLGEDLPARVFPTTGYREYINNINACDIHLSSFPFGSSNGIVDSCCQGLPVVNLLGQEPHARIDAMLVRRLGQPEWLTATSREAYVEAAVRLANDDALRVSISEQILAADPASHFLVKDLSEGADFAEMMLNLYQHHDAIQADGRKVWEPGALAEFAGHAGRHPGGRG